MLLIYLCDFFNKPMKFIASFFLLTALSVFAFGQQSKGAAAHNFSAVSLNGENVELNQLKGKVAVLTFWSTKCQICVSEMPNLNKLVDKYDREKVAFIGLTMNNEVMVRDFLKKKTFKFEIIPNSLGVLLKYADRDSKGRLLMGYPAYYVISQDGTVVLKESGWDQITKLDQTISNLLKTE
jgi:peroxiredoxin